MAKSLFVGSSGTNSSVNARSSQEYTVDGIYRIRHSLGVPATSALLQIYQCFCDETRLRILHLLTQRPLCVCHLQELLSLPQVKISKHLAYLREKDLVIVERHQNWMIYSLPARRSPELEANLRCLQDCVQTNPIFRGDARRLRQMKKDLCWVEAVAPSKGKAGAQ